MKKISIAIILACILCANGSFAAPAPTPAPSPSPSPEPLVKVTSPRSVKVKRYALFPLEIPAYVMRGITYPFIATLRFVERKWFSDYKKPDQKKKKFSLFGIGQAGGGEGLGQGFSFEIFDLFKGMDLWADYTFFLDIENRANLVFFSDPIDLGGRPFQFEFIVTRWRDRNEAEYFGIGSDTSDNKAGEYAYNQLTTGVTAQYEVLPHLRITLPLQFMTAEASPGRGDNHSPVQLVFPASELAGLDQRTSYFVTGLGIAHDTRDSQLYPLRGGYRGFRFTRFQDLSAGDFSFNQYEIELQQFIPLWAPRYVLMLRNAWTFQDATGGGAVPFNLLTSLDHYSPLRGFVVGRFRDEASVLFNVEYRFPVWSYTGIFDEKEGTFIDGVVFFDTGRVFPGIKNFSFDDWKFVGGGGLNILMGDKVMMKLEAGYGGEGALVFFKLGRSL